MSNLENLSKDKYTVISRILNSQNIVKAISYNNTDFLDQPNVESPEELLFDRIFPHRFIPVVSNDMKTYITLSFEDYRPVGNTFKSGKIVITVFTHQSLFKTDYGFLRVDYIISEIDKLFNEKSGLGLFKANFIAMSDTSITKDHHGAYIAYKLYEFNWGDYRWLIAWEPF